MTFFGVLITIFAEPLARYMIDNDEVVRLTVIFIWLLGSMQPLMAIEFSLGGALRGKGEQPHHYQSYILPMVPQKL
jgi:Na+-driven multidrug efflux pump